MCILRIQMQSSGPVITMTLNRDISNPDAGRVTRFGRVAEAAAAVTAFLESFEREK